jgi:hypothetical protein
MIARRTKEKQIIFFLHKKIWQEVISKDGRFGRMRTSFGFKAVVVVATFQRKQHLN